MASLRVLMVPDINSFGGESGIKRVIEAYHKYLPKYDIEVVDSNKESYDLIASHVTAHRSPDVLHCHGLYWTADYTCSSWEYRVNADIVVAARQAKAITVPSRWVSETFKRDMRLSPHVIGHGIEWSDWQGKNENFGYVLWNKNRAYDVCDPTPVVELAKRFPKVQFVSTFSPLRLGNIKISGVVPHDVMKSMVRSAAVYLSTTKETFGIGTLEAMASGVPVLGYAHGGNLDLVEHGVNGYLAQPGDIEDLANGLNYCLKYRDTLGKNGRAMALEWTWDKAVAKVAAVYYEAIKDDPPTVAIIIPTYNYASKVGRAIESALNQTYPLVTEIVVVDDGSTDNTREVVEKYVKKHPKVKYYYQQNSGVANARNKGVAVSSSKYICCLDADDAIHPDFIIACVDALERDRSIAIAYTGLWYIKPDGSEGLSSWPGEYNYDEQLTGRNQIPTCNVMRREVWERLGGQRQRYAPQGAGEEDAEMWLRAGAHGYGGKLATSAGLFIYSWMSGRVSGNRNHRMTDYRGWHPWVSDGIHPFASLASPKNGISHPVMQYDEPTISVIIPIGPRHTETVIDALDSLEAQHFRRWEVVCVIDTEMNKDHFARLSKAYPYVKWVQCENPPRGAGHARNVGVKHARAPLILFLDADDYLLPNALELMYSAWVDSKSIVYTDYIGIAIISKEEANKLAMRGRLKEYDEKSGMAVMSYRSFDYDCDRAIAQPDTRRPYIWCLISALHPKEWHKEIGGFDESMVSWEDWDYWIRLARAGKCFARIPQELVVYHFTSGDRREIGILENKKLIKYLQDKYEGVESMGCRGCGSKKIKVVMRSPQTSDQSQSGEGKMNTDDNYVLIQYASPNRGQHRVIGPVTRIDYGYHGGGDKFYVDKRDQESDQYLFRLVTMEKREAFSTVRTYETMSPPPELPVQDEEAETKIPQDESEWDSNINAIRLLQTIPAITDEIAKNLYDAGVRSESDILKMGITGLAKIDGVSRYRAKMIIDYLKAKGSDVV